MTAVFFLLILCVLSAIEWLPFSLILYYFILSGFSFLIYGFDKLLALNERRRISEKKLHVLALIGGWPGAYLGQQVFRHKISKQVFRRRFFLLVLINIAVLAAYLMTKHQQDLIVH
ncbi:MAG: uncharacterized membrane protein YsdA (DUF1294 family) [Oleispira sp.]|jgi:uncharacterized membrane protein YsdA (DUF1294 family)